MHKLTFTLILPSIGSTIWRNLSKTAWRWPGQRNTCIAWIRSSHTAKERRFPSPSMGGIKSIKSSHYRSPQNRKAKILLNSARLTIFTNSTKTCPKLVSYPTSYQLDIYLDHTWVQTPLISRQTGQVMLSTMKSLWSL